MAPASRGLRAPSSGLFGSPPQYEFCVSLQSGFQRPKGLSICRAGTHRL
jgi:hypothetical protein